MYRRAYKNRKAHQELQSVAAIIGLCSALYLYQKFSYLNTYLLLSIVGIVIVAFLAVVFILKQLAVERERQKLRALGTIDISVMDGLAFERYVAELLKCQGYTNVELTPHFDYGVDIIATKDNIRWGIQVKRYSGTVHANAVRQVVTALNTYKCQRAMIVTNSTYTRPAQRLAQDNNCVLIDKEALADWIIKFQQ